MGLKEYWKKRNFKETTEPKGNKKSSSKNHLCFVVQKHEASHLHYDFRLELGGVLKSWAIPKGPSMNPSDKRLAIQVEDHPLGYRLFEGIIPKGNYGAGTVMVWDEGTYTTTEEHSKKESEKILQEGLEIGKLNFILEGHKLKGGFSLIQFRGEHSHQWLLIKKNDEFASTEDITEKDQSVLSGQSMEEIRGK